MLPSDPRDLQAVHHYVVVRLVQDAVHQAVVDEPRHRRGRLASPHFAREDEVSIFGQRTHDVGVDLSSGVVVN